MSFKHPDKLKQKKQIVKKGVLQPKKSPKQSHDKNTKTNTPKVK